MIRCSVNELSNTYHYFQCEAMSERAQARLSDSAPPIDEICLANKYVDDENYSIVPRLYSGIMEES